MSGGIKYTRERLTEAAESCADIDEVIAHFGTRPYERLRRYLLQRFDHFGIDVSHFPRRKYTRYATEPPDTLPQVISASVSLAEVLRRLDMADNTVTRRLLHRWISEGALDTSHFLGQSHQRGKPGTTPIKTAEQILVKHDGRRRTKSAMLRRALRQIEVAELCDRCGTPPSWHGRPMTLEVDHINGDWSDDRAENLRLLCPNCHAITSTWCRGGDWRRGAHRPKPDPVQ
ncbi:HNH endonuclease signature motif containing protein [Streptomyces sp. NPDC050315]|uniref:HNH endonuclease signature motif containing protein n=1 Tax=Streptomyces sp. NPDC050315 TaxID=3155039 RepID=UPI003419FBA3